LLKALQWWCQAINVEFMILISVMLSVPKCHMTRIRDLLITGIVKLRSSSPDPSSGPRTSNVNLESINMRMRLLKITSDATKANNAETESS